MKFVPLVAAHWAWISQFIKPKLCEDTKGIVVEGQDGEILAAAVFDSWTYTSVNIHIGIRKPMVLRHGFLDAIADYVFKQAGRKYILGATPANNTAALKFNAHAGMREVYRLRDGFAEGVDLVYTQLSADEWYESRTT